MISLVGSFSIDPNVANKLLSIPEYMIVVRQLTKDIKYLYQLTLINITGYEQ